MVRRAITRPRACHGRGGGEAEIRRHVLKTGIADARGEALVAVVGLPARAANGEGGALLSSDVDVDVTAFFDPDILGKAKDFVPDPDELMAKLGAMKSNYTVDSRLHPGENSNDHH